MFNSLTARGKIILSLIFIVVILILCVAGYNAWQKHSDISDKLQQATVLSQQQAQDKNVLQNELDVSKQNAEMLASFIKQAQVGQVKPVTSFIIQAQSPQQAAQQVADRINNNDSTLPPAALEKTDNTVVSSVATTAEQKAAIDKQNAKDGTNINDSYLNQVYKNNNYRNWEWSAGYGWQEGSKYIPIGLQRNYSKDRAIEVEVHVDPAEPKHVTGGEIKYIYKTDKLFLLF